MSHKPAQEIHGYTNRALDVRVDVDTSASPLNFTNLGFRVQDQLDKTGLTADAGGNGVLVDFTLSAAEMSIPSGWYRWECYATVAGQLRVLAQGQFHVGSEPTTEEES